MAILANAVLCVLSGMLSLFLAYRGIWLAAAICGAFTLVFSILFHRAASGVRRRLLRREARALAWVLVALGLCGVAIGMLPYGSRTHRLMALGGSITMLSAGIAGLGSRKDD